MCTASAFKNSLIGSFIRFAYNPACVISGAVCINKKVKFLSSLLVRCWLTDISVYLRFNLKMLEDSVGWTYDTV